MDIETVKCIYKQNKDKGKTNKRYHRAHCPFSRAAYITTGFGWKGAENDGDIRKELEVLTVTKSEKFYM